MEANDPTTDFPADREMRDTASDSHLGSAGAADDFLIGARGLAEIGRGFYDRGWLLGTSGNLSAVIGRDPLRMAITSSGVDKGRLSPEDILEIDAKGRVLGGTGKPSAETALHLAVVRERDAGSVLHTHSVWNTMISDACLASGGVRIEGYEMLKGLSGVASHEHSEWIPVIENSQDYALLVTSIERSLKQHPDAHGFLLRRHGLYTWGGDLAEAKRHVEILEFLFEVLMRTGTVRG